MDIGAHLNRVVFAFAGLIVALAVVMSVTPVDAAPVDAAAVNAAAPARPGRADVANKPAPKPRPKHEARAQHTKTRHAKKAALPEVSNAAGEPLTVTGACEENLAIAAKQGLTLPDGWTINCVGPGLDWDGNSHWGVTCPYDSCPEGAGPYVSISNPTYYVVAHELCHANFGNDELMADSCAAEHGASLETSPYQ